MNIVAKKKIETAIQEDLRAHISTYQNKRNEEREALCEKLRKNPPSLVSNTLKEMKLAYGKLQELESKLLKNGYSIARYGSNEFSKKDFELSIKDSKERDAFDEETNSRISKLQSLGRSYTLKIYSELGEIEKVLADFSKDIAKLLK